MRIAHAIVLGTVVGGVIATGSVIATVPEGEPVKLSPQYYTVKSDDERVRVLKYRLKPGQKEAMHSHPEYVIHFFGSADLRTTLGDGKTTESSVTEGEVLLRGPLTHTVENVGNTELHALLVELKNGRR